MMDICHNLFLWAGLAPVTLLSSSGQRFGTKSDVTPFIKPIDRRISFNNPQIRGPYIIFLYPIERLHLLSPILRRFW